MWKCLIKKVPCVSKIQGIHKRAGLAINPVDAWRNCLKGELHTLNRCTKTEGSWNKKKLWRSSSEHAVIPAEFAQEVVESDLIIRTLRLLLSCGNYVLSINLCQQDCHSTASGVNLLAYCGSDSCTCQVKSYRLRCVTATDLSHDIFYKSTNTVGLRATTLSRTSITNSSCTAWRSVRAMAQCH